MDQCDVNNKDHPASSRNQSHVCSRTAALENKKDYIVTRAFWSLGCHRWPHRIEEECTKIALNETMAGWSDLDDKRQGTYMFQISVSHWNSSGRVSHVVDSSIRAYYAIYDERPYLRDTSNYNIHQPQNILNIPEY